MDYINQLVNMQGIMFLARWLHFFFGVMWIGHLYYFNFTQGTAVAQMDAPGKSNVTNKLLPVALYWFRWGAMWTMVSGLFILAVKGHTEGMEVFKSSWGVSILIGAVLGLTMWYNVWFLIWPKQQIIMASAAKVAAGGQADPQAAAVAPMALLASRTNTLMSIPMLFFMGSASHLPIPVRPETNLTLLTVILGILWLVLEGNVFKGKIGPMQTVKGVITSGFVLTGVIVAIIAAVV
jgi:uncharacterized membrane protein